METQNTTQPDANELLYVQPFADIQNRLVERVPELLYVDEDWGQLDYYDNMPPVQWPCALIDCSTISASQMGNHVLIDEIGVIISIADMRLSNSGAQAEYYQKKEHYRLFAIMADIVRCLHGWTGRPDTYGRLQRISQMRRQRNDGIRLYEIAFACQMMNRTAVKNVKLIAAQPVIKRG